MHGGLVNSEERERFEIVNPHWLRVAVKEEAIPLFTLSQSFLGALAFSDVARHALHSGWFSILVSEARVHFEGHPVAVFSDDLQFISGRPDLLGLAGKRLSGQLQVFRGDEVSHVHPATFSIGVTSDPFACFVR